MGNDTLWHMKKKPVQSPLLLPLNRAHDVIFTYMYAVMMDERRLTKQVYKGRVSGRVGETTCTAKGAFALISYKI